MKVNRRIIPASCLILWLSVSACRNSSAPVASASPTPKEISSSDQVVKAFSHFIPAASPPANIELVVSPGYHINAHPATFPYLIATEITPGKVDGITVGDKPAYPAPKMEKFVFADQPLAVYEGSVTIPITLTADPAATGHRTIPFTIRVQACDTQQCFPPATLDAALPLDVAAIKH